MRPEKVTFSFGENWLRYLERLGPERYQEAKRSVQDLLGEGALAGKAVLDIGCGSGIFSLAAIELGARRVVSMDVDPRSIEACRRVRQQCDAERWEVIDGSVLDRELLDSLGVFDVVYAWGVLHHTGAMWEAVDNAAGLVAPGGRLALAIYNRTWTSGLWLRYKRLYNCSPNAVKSLLVWAILLPRMAVRLARLRHPLKDRRGMSVYHDAIDWAGGLPYEYASWDEVVAHLTARGLHCARWTGTKGIGCNEFVFTRPGT